MNAMCLERLKRGAVLLNTLPPRVTYEFLVELAGQTDSVDVMLRMLDKYSVLTPDIVHALGADKLPPRQLHVVPREDAA